MRRRAAPGAGDELVVLRCVLELVARAAVLAVGYERSLRGRLLLGLLLGARIAVLGVVYREEVAQRTLAGVA